MREGGEDDERTNVVTGVGRGAVDEVFEMRGIVDMTRDVVSVTMGVVVEMGEGGGTRAEEREERTIDDDGSSVEDGGEAVSGGDVVEV